MHFTSTIPLVLSIAVAGVAATPFKFPLPDGFPSPNPAQLAMIEKKAGGTLPDGPLPTILKGAGITTLQLLALNEIFEVAYFTELLANVTNSVPGYDAASIAPLDKTYVMDTLTAVVNVSNRHLALKALTAPFAFSEPAIVARAIACRRRKWHFDERQPNRHQALSIPIPRYHFRPGRPPRPNLHRHRPRNATRGASHLRRRRR